MDPQSLLSLQREGVEALAGYLSLHQTVEGLTIMWTPNQLMNGCCENREEELDRRYDTNIMKTLPCNIQNFLEL